MIEQKIRYLKSVPFDSINKCFFDSIITIYGRWSGYDLTGMNGNNTAWLIVQDADNFIDFQEKCLVLPEEALTNHNTKPHNIAYLYDCIQINKRLKQKYGTQLRIINWESIFIDLENIEKVEMYRNCFNLPPLSIYNKSIKQKYSRFNTFWNK